MTYTSATPYIAAFVIFRRDNQIAFLLREHTAWMNGYYGLASGKVENNESYMTAAIREAMEEVGIELRLSDIKYVHTMHRKGNDSEWVDVFFEATSWQGEPINAEPHIHAELKWFSIDSLPDNVIPPVRHALEQIEKGKNYSEYGWGSTS